MTSGEAHVNRLGAYIAVGVLSAAVLLFLWCSYARSLRCGDFALQGDAQLFFILGARQLDGFDNDGVACEGLSPLYTHKSTP